jgi:hypothetical protein
MTTEIVMEPTPKLTPDLERMVQVKAEYLADAISVGHELAFMMECHPETYRECKPKTTVEERMSELGWLWTVFDNAIEKAPSSRSF